MILKGALKTFHCVGSWSYKRINGSRTSRVGEYKILLVLFIVRNYEAAAVVGHHYDNINDWIGLGSQVPEL